MIFILLGVIAGIAIPLILNTLLANKIENKTHRICLKAALHIVCIVLFAGFIIIGSLPAFLDTFITGRLGLIELTLTEAFPDSDILETNINTNELKSIIGELKQTVDGIDTSGDNYFETLIYNAFLGKFTGYVYAVENGVNTLTMTDDKNSPVTVRSVLYNLKDTAMKTLESYFLIGQFGILFLLVICIAAYIALAAFLKKGGAEYNKSVVFGNIDYNNRGEEPQDEE